MSRRNAVEGVNGNLKRNFVSVDRGYVRLFGSAKIKTLFAFTLAGLNMMLANSFRRTMSSEPKQAPPIAEDTCTPACRDVRGRARECISASAGRDPPRPSRDIQQWR